MAASKAPLKTNKEWHAANRMPLKATLAQRVDWHMAHAKNCGCRPMPDSVKNEVAKRNK